MFLWIDRLLGRPFYVSFVAESVNSYAQALKAIQMRGVLGERDFKHLVQFFKANPFFINYQAPSVSAFPTHTFKLGNGLEPFTFQLVEEVENDKTPTIQVQGEGEFSGFCMTAELAGGERTTVSVAGGVGMHIGKYSQKLKRLLVQKYGAINTDF